MSIHQRNLQILATENLNVRNDLRPEITEDIFKFAQKSYNLRNDLTLQRQRKQTVYFRKETISSFAPKI